jgi:hypothetical protein
MKKENSEFSCQKSEIGFLLFINTGERRKGQKERIENRESSKGEKEWLTLL